MNRKDNSNELLADSLSKFNVSQQLYECLLREEKKRVHLQRRRNITTELRQIIESQSKGGSK
jgi:hypothetical protein